MKIKERKKRIGGRVGVDGVIALKRNIMTPPLSVVYWPGRKNDFSAGLSEVATFYIYIYTPSYTVFALERANVFSVPALFVEPLSD